MSNTFLVERQMLDGRWEAQPVNHIGVDCFVRDLPGGGCELLAFRDGWSIRGVELQKALALRIVERSAAVEQSPEDARKLCNCAGCGDELEQHEIGGRIHGRPYCDGCLRSEGRPPGLSENLTPRQRAKLTHTGG